MKALLIKADDTVQVIELAGALGAEKYVGPYDVINMPSTGAVMVVSDTGLIDELPRNRRAFLFLVDYANKLADVAGDAVVFMDDGSDLDLTTLPEWTQRVLAA